jgi:DNA mismatch endonuclease (patch repair protein)
MDTVSKERRSEIMAAVKARDTAPEIQLRRMIHAMGYRYRLHGKDLPGRPDLIFPARRKIIFVHGCFWHHHANCSGGRMPKTRADFWSTKLQRNVSRDEEVESSLRKLGWDVLVVWECELRGLDLVRERVVRFLGELTPPAIDTDVMQS